MTVRILAIPTDPVPSSAEPLAVDAKTLARMLCCSVRHIERQDAAGKLPAPVRIGRSKRWRAAEIDAWLQAGCPDRHAWEAVKAAGGVP